MFCTVQSWLADPNPADRKIIYHVGHLATDRQQDPELHKTAELLVGAGEIDWPVLSACSHVRRFLKGSRKVRLTQMPGRPGEGFVYIAERLD